MRYLINALTRLTAEYDPYDHLDDKDVIDKLIDMLTSYYEATYADGGENAHLDEKKAVDEFAGTKDKMELDNWYNLLSDVINALWPLETSDINPDSIKKAIVKVKKLL